MRCRPFHYSVILDSIRGFFRDEVSRCVLTDLLCFHGGGRAGVCKQEMLPLSQPPLPVIVLPLMPSGAAGTLTPFLL